MNKVGVLVMMTGKYIQYFKGFKASFDRHFLKSSGEADQYTVHYFLFTDGSIEGNPSDVTITEQKRLGWPFDS